jgi:hypothetical protein
LVHCCFTQNGIFKRKKCQSQRSETTTSIHHLPDSPFFSLYNAVLRTRDVYPDPDFYPGS